MLYYGRCHCNGIHFELDTETIVAAVHCNCSICSRRAVLMSEPYFSPTEMKNLQGKELLTLYQFGDHMVNHYFCSRCGVYPFHETTEKPGYYRLNLACIAGLDLGSLHIREIDGRSY